MLREQILKLDPKSIGFQNPPQFPVYAYLLETGHPQAVSTQVVVADGSVSLYFSNGGGMIGLGGNSAVRKESAELLAGAGHFLPQCIVAADHPLPRKGYCRFYLLTVRGVFTAEALEDDLGNGRSPLSSLFLKSHQLLSLIRKAYESRQG